MEEFIALMDEANIGSYTKEHLEWASNHITEEDELPESRDNYSSLE